MEDSISQLDDMIAVLEVSIPANPAAPKYDKMAIGYEAVLADYFKKIKNAFPYDALDSIYNKYVKESGWGGQRNLREQYSFNELGNVVDPILKLFKARLIKDIIGRFIEIYLAGSAEMLEWGRTKGGKPIYFEGPAMRQAMDYATEHCAQLVTNMDEESKQLIADIVRDAIDNKRGVEGLAHDLRAKFDDMSSARSRMIARTETSNALEQAFLDRSKAMGVTGKEWIAYEPCEVCAGNAELDPIPIDSDEYEDSEGVNITRPPAHPNCRCALAPVMLEERNE